MAKQRIGFSVRPSFIYSTEDLTYPQGVTNIYRFRKEHFAMPGDELAGRIPMWEWHRGTWMCYGEDVIDYVVRQIREAHGQTYEGQPHLD